ncbi:MAG: GAF domain-containing protein [Desulfovibrio sp.]|nr:GAF domain-containing protein [Desulfovibrio sp.]
MSETIEELILRIIVTVFDSYSAVLFFPEEDNEICTLAAFFSKGKHVDRDARIVPGQGLVGWIVRNHQVLCVPNFDHYQSKLGYYTNREEEQIKAFMGCPLSCGGVLCLDSKRQYAFSEKDHTVLQHFADLIARLRVSNSQQHFLADIPRYFTDLSLLQDLPQRFTGWSDYLKEFLHILVSSTGFDYAAFASVENPGETYIVEAETAPLFLQRGNPVTFSMNVGVAGWVFKNEQQVVVDGIDNVSSPILFAKMPEDIEFKALMCLPIMVDKETKAVLCLAHRESVHLDESLRSFVRLAVEQMSSFLENLNLRVRLKQLMPKVELAR